MDTAALTWPGLLFHSSGLALLALLKSLTSCEETGCIDCYVVFERRDWVEAARQCLKSRRMVQLFSDVIYLDPHDEIEAVSSFARESVSGSMQFIEKHGVDILAKPNVTVEGK